MVIHLFKEFEIFYNEMFCLDREIKKNLKCMHFFEVFQLVKLEKIQILRWNLKFFSLNLTLWIQPQTDPANMTRPDDTNGSSRPDEPNGSGGLRT